MQATLLESIILLYLILVSMLTFITFKDSLISILLPLIMLTSLIAAAIGIYDAAAGIVGLPRLFPARSSGEILSGFRNAGQAGAYFLVIVTILFPIRFSEMYMHLPVKTRKLLNISLVTSLVFLALSGKIAAYVGIFVGILGYAIMKRNFRTIISLSTLGVLLIVLFVNLESIAPKTYERIAFKYDTRVRQKLSGDFSEGDFLVTNLGKSIDAFTERPITGSGLGAFVGNYGEHEVHSTYFKMLGETGLIGLLGYIIFALGFISMFRKGEGMKREYSSYLRSMLPFIIGCFISWAYTYHMRKREFWLLLAVILITIYKGINEKSAELEQKQKVIQDEVN